MIAVSKFFKSIPNELGSMINSIPKIKSGDICLLFRSYNMHKIEDNKKLIHFHAIDQNFTVNCNTVVKIAVSISKAAALVSSRKTARTDSLQCRFRLNQWLSKENLDLVDQN
jgi:hypothetical protein